MAGLDPEQEANAQKFLSDRTERAIALRSKDREFHGLEREFRYFQEQMLVDYKKSKDIKHPRDVGDAREEILRKFLRDSGLIPKRYAVSERSARVASTTGHVTKEIDILLYDPFDSISLMNREDVYEVLPVESVYGVIQVKSRLNKAEIKDGLANLASFKTLQRSKQTGVVIRQGGKAERGFGLLFAYDSDLEWGEIIAELEAFAKENPNNVWCNAVFILNKGMFLFGEESKASASNVDIEAIKVLQMHGHPDRQGIVLFQFYSILFSLLRETSVQPAAPHPYYRLPLVAGGHAYEFCLGPFAEFATCEKHGDYQRKISPEKIEALIKWCSEATPVNTVKATHLAMGMPDDDEAYKRQPGMVRIYNPENLPLTENLLMDKTNGNVIYDMIACAGMVMYIPHYYSSKEGIFTGCAKCKAKPSED